MDLSILIKVLLNDNETVIIPGFGAFISVYKPAVIRETDIIPPGKEIRFFHQIKNNDGLLAMQIARSKKISYDDAFKRIERATSKIIYELDKGEKVTFGELGVFFYNENGEIQFTQFQTDEPVLSAGFEPVSLEDITENQEETKTEQLIVPEPVIVEEPELKAEDIVTEQELPTETEAIKEEQIEEAKPEKEKVIFQSPVTGPTKAEIKEKKKSFAWLWILLAVGVIIIIVFFVLAKEKKAPAPDAEDRSQNVKIETIQPEAVVPDSIQPADTMTATVSQPLTISLIPKFHLVGGGFKSEENAVKYINRLKEKEIEGTLLGQKGKIYLVGIASFDTEQEAFNELNRRMRENPEWKLWIYKK